MRYPAFLVLLSFSLLGCANHAVMSKVNRIDSPPEKMALVNFVRPQVFAGDGIAHEIWDGVQFVGTLKAGSMVQYVGEPGLHIFMADSKNRGWAYRRLNLNAGDVYYIKSNLIPFAGIALGVADPYDERIAKWNEVLAVVSVDRLKSKPLKQEAIAEAAEKLEEIRFKQIVHATVNEESFSQQLEELQALLEKGLISEEEHEDLRQALIQRELGTAEQ